MKGCWKTGQRHYKKICKQTTTAKDRYNDGRGCKKNEWSKADRIERVNMKASISSFFFKDDKSTNRSLM